METTLLRHSPRRMGGTLVLGVSLFFNFLTRVDAQQSAARQWNEEILGAIRRNLPDPPAHARNLFHLSVAMYDAWAAYDPNCVNYLKHEKVATLPPDVEAARHEAISYAAHTVLLSRFGTGTGSVTTTTALDARLAALGFSPTLARAATTSEISPAMLGKRCGARVLLWGSQDGFGNTSYPEAYTAAVNPNMALPMSVLGTNSNGVADQPLGAGVPLGTDPNFWQPLAFSSSITQNNIVIPGGIQPFAGVQSLATTPFSLSRKNPVKPWMDPFNGPSRLSIPGAPSPTNAAARQSMVEVLRLSAKLNSLTSINISPKRIGNNPLGSDGGPGYDLNPVTGQPYPDVFVQEGDFGRVLAEYWADGPNSETPPGHWHVMANEVADKPGFQKRIEGVGPVVNNLEWDVKVYFALAGAVHDAACAAWSLKRYYSGARPITQIRWAGTQGQSTTNGFNIRYSPYGLPLEPGVIEQISWDTVGSGGRHENILDFQMNRVEWGGAYVNQVVVFSWPAEHASNPAPSLPAVAATHKSDVRWMLAKDWLPFQRKTFNTPAFPGYVSGHSAFSRAAAEVLTNITGSALFPGGYHSHTIAANTMQIDRGPSTNVKLGWATYYDAADQAGQSRRWGGIHVAEDDYHGRVIGSQAGKAAYALAKSYWTASIKAQILPVTVTLIANEHREVSYTAIRGLNHKVQSSTDLLNWVDETTNSLAYDTDGSWVDTSPSLNHCYYRVIASGQP